MNRSIYWGSQMRLGRSFRAQVAKPIWVHVMIMIAIVIIVIVQGFLMNVYYINRYQQSIVPYMWFFADICNAFAFMGSLLIAHKYLRKRRRGSFGLVGISTEHRFVWQPGVFPLLYVSWLFYSTIVVTKITLMIHLDIVLDLSYHELFGPSAVQVATSLSGFVYMLLLEGHVYAPTGTVRYMVITYVCTNMALDIVDSASLVSFIHTYAHHETLGDITGELIYAIEFVCVTTYFVPALMLYQMSIGGYQDEMMEGPLGTLVDLLHLLLLDIPIISIRIYLWSQNDYYSSVYLLRNVFSAVVISRRLISEFSEMVYMCRYVSRHPVYSSPSQYFDSFRREMEEKATSSKRANASKGAPAPQDPQRPPI